MTREETIKVLAILKAAYPNSYKGMTKDEANGMIATWQMQFHQVPANVLLIAINKLISTNQFPPAISEVRTTLRNMYVEAKTMLRSHEESKLTYKLNEGLPNEEVIRFGTPLDDKTVSILQQIVTATENMRLEAEITLPELFASNNQMFLPSGKHK